MKATASTAEFEGTLDHRWISQLGKLDIRLRSAGFRISPDRWLNIADLLTDLMLQNGINKNADYHLNVKQYLSPLICKSALEQQEFSRVFSYWWEDIYPPETDAVKDQVETEAEHKIVNRFSNSVLAFGVLIFLVVTVVTASIYFEIFQPETQTEIPQPATQTKVDPGSVGPEPVDPEPVDPATTTPPDIKPRVEKDITDIYSLSDSSLALIQLMLVCLLPMFMVLMLLIGGFRPMLRKGKANRDSPLRFLTLKLANDDLFDDPKLRAAIRSLHAPLSLPTTRLDPKRTVYASLQQGGLFSPVYAKRAEVPEVMVWINSNGKLDPVKALADTLVDRLRAADLRVIAYSYRNRPNRLLDSATDLWVSGTEVQDLHPGARLILVTSSAGLIDVWSEKALLWVSNLAKQFNTVVLEPGAHDTANSKSLKAAGIESCALSSEGICQVCAIFSQTPQATAAQRLAVLPQYLDQEERWRSPITPKKMDLEILLSTLLTYLGESGYSLLCASAVYPEFRWGLIRALDLSLFTQDNAINRETRLLAIAQLSWARDGWLPEWLRLSLIRSQSKSQQETARMLYQQLLIEVEIQGEASIQLPVRIHKPKGGVRSYLRQWIKRSNQNSDLEDSVFVELMLGGRFRRLDFELPRVLEKFFRVNNTMRHAISSVSLLGFALLLAWGSNSVANHYSLNQKIQQVWTNHITTDKPLTIQIYYNQTSLLLGEQLQSVMGSQESVVIQPLINTEESENNNLRQQFEGKVTELQKQNQGIPIDGLIVYQADYKQQAQWLADRVAYAGYGLRAKILDISDFPELTDVASVYSFFKLTLWLPKGVKESLVLRGHTESLESARFSYDGSKVVTAARDNTARVWNATSGKELLILRGHTNKIDFATFSPDDSQIITVSRGGTARLWDASSGETIYKLEGHTSRIDHAAFSPDGTRIVTASRDNTARVWETDSGKLLHILEGHTGDVRYAAFSPDGRRIVTASYDKTAKVWDVQRGQLILTLLGHSNNVNYATFSRNGGLIATASRDSTAKIYDSGNGKLLYTLAGHTNDVRYVGFSPDGTRIVTASRDTTAKLWDVTNGKLLHTLEGHNRDIMRATFSPDGSKIATASDDRTARVWDSTIGKILIILGQHNGDVIDVSFSPDSDKIVTASDDMTARIWDIQEEIAKQANNIASSAIPVPELASLDLNEAIVKLKEVDLTYEIRYELILDGKDGKVFKTEPAADTRLVASAPVMLFISARGGWVYLGKVLSGVGVYQNDSQAKNMRHDDDNSGKRIGTLKAQETVKVIESKQNGWTLVQAVDQ
jgi:WD40 repeat protein